MSFLKKAFDAASVAKGRIDDYRTEQDAASIKPVEASPDAYAAGALASALRAGAVDPRGLLTLEEASEIAGQALGSPSLTYSDQSIGIRYAAEDRRARRWSVEATTWYLDGTGSLDEVWEMLDPVIETGEAVDGLGQAACWDGTRLYVRTEQAVFHVEVTVPDEKEPRGRARLAAQDVIARLDEAVSLT